MRFKFPYLWQNSMLEINIFHLSEGLGDQKSILKYTHTK